MRTRIKICGITTVADGLAAAAAGADAIGLVFYPKSPRYVHAERAAEIAAALPPFVNVVGLFVNATPEFINETLASYCREERITLTRSRVHQKNDQAWIEQKNGAVIRRMVGHDRLSGIVAGQVLAQLLEAVRLYVNFFQPSFKLKNKTRDGARLSKCAPRSE